MYINLLIIAKNPFLDEEFPDTNETKNELKKLRAMSKASKQAELKRYASKFSNIPCLNIKIHFKLLLHAA
jgi:hypothetical protein